MIVLKNTMILLLLIITQPASLAIIAVFIARMVLKQDVSLVFKISLITEQSLNLAVNVFAIQDFMMMDQVFCVNLVTKNV